MPHARTGRSDRHRDQCSPRAAQRAARWLRLSERRRPRPKASRPRRASVPAMRVEPSAGHPPGRSEPGHHTAPPAQRADPAQRPRGGHRPAARELGMEPLLRRRPSFRTGRARQTGRTLRQRTLTRELRDQLSRGIGEVRSDNGTAASGRISASQRARVAGPRRTLETAARLRSPRCVNTVGFVFLGTEGRSSGRGYPAAPFGPTNRLGSCGKRPTRRRSARRDPPRNVQPEPCARATGRAP